MTKYTAECFVSRFKSLKGYIIRIASSSSKEIRDTLYYVRDADLSKSNEGVVLRLTKYREVIDSLFKTKVHSEVGKKVKLTINKESVIDDILVYYSLRGLIKDKIKELKEVVND